MLTSLLIPLIYNPREDTAIKVSVVLWGAIILCCRVVVLLWCRRLFVRDRGAFNKREQDEAVKMLVSTAAMEPQQIMTLAHNLHYSYQKIGNSGIP